eukprot:TRINITY_DN1320_c0_g5_i1.p1 TRINITY_DN1320_c0_g5~~TRINITY_DN1320_c0_g5_i1.p1  ORF type:complete len:954 (-),score=179.98 TRINITY_DN1320_c0_g5_i1:764-3625(-)
MEHPAEDYTHGGVSKGWFSWFDKICGSGIPCHKIDNHSPEWTATIFTTAEIKKDKQKLDLLELHRDTEQKLDFLDLNLVGEDGYIDAEKEGCNLATWKHATWMSLDNRDIGFTYTGKIQIPASIGTPQVAVFWHTGGKDNPESFLISRLVLTPPDDAGQQPITFAVNSNIHHKQGPRVFFDDKPRLPAQTSKFLEKFRAFELSELRGKKELSNPTDWDRVYQYDVYNDLGNPTEAKTSRPVLGGFVYEGDVFDKNGNPNTPKAGKGEGRKIGFPRRLRTGRGFYKTPLGNSTLYENLVTKQQPDYWLPLDEKFDALKAANFSRTRTLYLLSLVKAILSGLAKSQKTILRGVLDITGDNPTPFPDFECVDSLYKTPVADAIVELDTAIAQVLGTLQKVNLEAVSLVFGVQLADLKEFLDSAKEGKKLHMTEGLQTMVTELRKLITQKYAEPFVKKDREDLWETDEEWGRQAIAGHNPCIIQAIKEIPKESTVSEQDLKPHLGGHSLKDLLELEAPRLFLIDYSAVYPEYSKFINSKEEKPKDDGKAKEEESFRCQYAGRAYLFLRDDNQLVPVAIELFTGETPHVVYTPSDPPNLWLIVKAVFASIDSGFHQLYSHFTRTHGCLEPALIATRRHISAMHPVYKLLMPHFRFTLNINKNARQTLINNGGIIERTFTPGKFSMTLAAEVYTKLWRFDKQSLPEDLIARNMAKRGEDGKVELLLPDYPYGSDGLLVWNSVEKWVSEYLSLYYTGGEGATVTSDPELMAWWEEFKHEGHADKTEGWPPLESVKDLTLILTTIIWLASAHHAAVNFGQYDYSGYIPNRSSIVHGPIPTKGTKKYKNLVANLDRHFFKILARPFEALLVMTTVALLSTHSENEQYISDREHFYIFDDKAREIYNKHVDIIMEVEKEIEIRNENKNSTVRSKSQGGLPYTLLTPTSGKGKTGRGIPNSVSI